MVCKNNTSIVELRLAYYVDEALDIFNVLQEKYIKAEEQLEHKFFYLAGFNFLMRGGGW